VDRLRLSDRRFAVAVLLLYAAVVLFVVSRHEPWRDEADSWLLVRDASLPEILALMPYAGTPALWYLLLFPFAKAGLPFFAQSLINAAVMIAAAAVWLHFAPFSRTIRVLALFSYYLVYEYAVIARSYGLTVLLLFAAAALHDTRFSNPLRYAIAIALLMNANSHSFAIGCVLGAAFVVGALWTGGSAGGRRPTGAAIAAMLVMLAAAGAAYLQLRAPADGNMAATERPAQVDLPGRAVGEAFLPLAPVAVSKWIGIAVLVLLTVHLFRSREALLFLWVSIAGMAAVFVYIWAGGLRHFGLIFLIAVVSLWISGRPLHRYATFVASALLACSVLAGIVAAVQDVRAPFSGAKEMAGFIERSGLQSRIIAGHGPAQTAAVLPYFPRKKIWYAGLGEFGSYQKWDRDFERAQRVAYPEAVARSKKQFAGRPWLLLLNVEMPDPEQEGFRLLFRNGERPFAHPDERFWLYEPVR
jgi:hypothetical protein